jgi:hypothetical protein
MPVLNTPIMQYLYMARLSVQQKHNALNNIFVTLYVLYESVNINGYELKMRFESHRNNPSSL